MGRTPERKRAWCSADSFLSGLCCGLVAPGQCIPLNLGFLTWEMREMILALLDGCES